MDVTQTTKQALMGVDKGRQTGLDIKPTNGQKTWTGLSNGGAGDGMGAPSLLFERGKNSRLFNGW